MRGRGANYLIEFYLISTITTQVAVWSRAVTPLSSLRQARLVRSTVREYTVLVLLSPTQPPTLSSMKSE